MTFMPAMVIPSPAEPDPTKHVNYVLGMVLGVDDFNQEFAYLAERDRWIARELSGYGTKRGLRVFFTGGADAEPEIVVSSGAAITPRGQLVRVSHDECAKLNDWIAQNRDTIVQRFALQNATTADIDAYVVISYRACATDLVPLPGEPCRTEDETMAHSRIADDHALELRLDPPKQIEEDSIRAFIAWLAATPLVPSGGTPLPDFLAAIVKAAENGNPFMDGSPPSVDAAAAGGHFRAALRTFVTTLHARKEWLADGQTAAGVPPKEDDLLLAKLRLSIVGDLSGNWKLEGLTENPEPVQILEEARPILLSTRLLTEALVAAVERAAKVAQAARLAVLYPALNAGWSYVVVAAGQVKVAALAPETVPDPATQNPLTAWVQDEGHVFVRFTKPSFSEIRYVVKVLPVHRDINEIPVATFAGWQVAPLSDMEIFDLRITNGAKVIAKDSLKNLELIIEVSAYVRP